MAALIRGKVADEALHMLRFLPNRSARLIEQVLKSALGNAEDRGARDIEELIIDESRIDGGPMMKRHRPRARGTARVPSFPRSRSMHRQRRSIPNRSPVG